LSYRADILRSVRPYQPDDRPALRAFQRQWFGATSRHVDDTFFEWLFERNPHARDGQAPLWLCVRDGVVVGQQAAIPVILKVDALEQRAAWMVDWMVDPAWRLKGVAPALLSANTEEYDLMLGLGVEEAPHKAMLRDRWEDLGSLSLFVRPLDAQACARLLRIPMLLAKAAPRIVLSGSVRALAGIATTIRRVTLEPISAFDERSDSVWRSAKDEYPVLVKRDLQSVAWRYDDGPFKELYQRFYVKHRAATVGYVVVRLAQWRGHTVGRVVDYLVPRRYLRPAFALVLDLLGSQRTIAAFFEQWHPGSAGLLRSLGCVRARASHRFMFRLRDAASPLAPKVRDAARWFVMPGDADFDHVLIGTEGQRERTA
jgi:GNAT superfamily N-acetyltransferase